jgi:hypothetical protein
MSRHRRHPRIDRVLEYMRRPYHSAPEPAAHAGARATYIKRKPERLEYEGPIVVSLWRKASTAWSSLADAPHPDNLAELVYEMLEVESEDGWLPDVDVYARVVVEILPDPRPDVLTTEVDAPQA